MTEIKRTDLDHMNFLQSVADEDVAHLNEKEKTYGGSWKRRGGVGAFMMLARKWDRIENILSNFCEFAKRHDIHASDFDVITACTINMTGADGTIRAEIRDLRRYLMLVEAEAMAIEAKNKTGLRQIDRIDTGRRDESQRLVPRDLDRIRSDSIVGEHVTWKLGTMRERLYGTVIGMKDDGSALVRPDGVSDSLLDWTLATGDYVLTRNFKGDAAPAVPVSDSSRHAERAEDPKFPHIITKQKFNSLGTMDASAYVLLDNHAVIDRRKLPSEAVAKMGKFRTLVSLEDLRGYPDWAKELYDQDAVDEGNVQMKRSFRKHWGEEPEAG